MISKQTIKKFCCEDPSLIENYDKAINDTTQIWHCHHKRENIYTRKELIQRNEYFKRPASELIFLTNSEHMSLHKKGVPHGPRSEAVKNRISKTMINSPKISKKILQLTKSGQLIREWPSMNEAMRQTGIGNIYRCCRGITKYAGGFIWRYSTL